MVSHPVTVEPSGAIREQLKPLHLKQHKAVLKKMAGCKNGPSPCNESKISTTGNFADMMKITVFNYSS